MKNLVFIRFGPKILDTCSKFTFIQWDFFSEWRNLNIVLHLQKTLSPLTKNTFSTYKKHFQIKQYLLRAISLSSSFLDDDLDLDFCLSVETSLFRRLTSSMSFLGILLDLCFSSDSSFDLRDEDFDRSRSLFFSPWK